MVKSLKRFILGGVLSSSVLIFLAVYLFTYFMFSSLLESRARETSHVIARETFNTMFQVMRRGWTRHEVEEFIGATKAAFENSTLEVEIYRGPIVEKLFGKIRQKSPDALIEEAFLVGDPVNVIRKNQVRYVFPLHARHECLRCHVNAAVGNVMGVIEVSQDLNPIIQSARKSYIIFFLLFLPLPALIAILIASYVMNRINASIRNFRAKVESVNSVKDIKNLEMVESDLGFREINALFHNVVLLVEKLRNLAIDKDILEFEIKLMDKFIITSDVVKDWKEYIKELLVEINTIIEAYSLFTIFRIDEEEYDLEIFWKGSTSAELRSMFEEIIKDRIRVDPHFSDVSTISINHNTADARTTLPNLSRHHLELETKTLILDSPKIGGVVGIGVQSELVKDPTRFIVIESILTTLLNVVGSVKAIYKYTKDLEYFATRDPLTNLYNQRIFWDMLGYEIGRAERHGYRFALLMIDLDNFKTINDRHGHTFGDFFLKEYAKTIRQATRQEDIVARYGGDEFTVILPETDENQAFLIATRIRSSIDNLTLTAPDNSRVRGTVSMGITIYPDHATTARDLFLVADNMMYRAKREGKNTLQIPTEEDVAEVFKEIGEKSMVILRAIEEKRLIPYFQPIVDAKSGKTEIHELLMRIGLEDGIMEAAEFVDVAENMGVIHKMDFLLLENAFRKIRDERYQGVLFVNLSPRALILSEFMNRVGDLAGEFGIDTSKIVFEITERETVRNLALLEGFVRELKSRGFKFAVDDFGSGFSSFAYIKHFPIDYIKIEGEFIRNMVASDMDRALVKSVTALAEEVGILTVAEYVESEEILDAVQRLRINYAQGYYCGRPSADFRV